MLRNGITWRPLQIYYSCKANPAVAVLRLLRGMGARLDACSPGDLALAAVAGYEDAEIGYVGFSMTDAEIERVARSGALFIADSLSQVRRIGEGSPGRTIGLRVNCDVRAGFHPHVQAGDRRSKFGVQPHQVPEVLALAAGYGLRIAAVHSHIGSDILDVSPHLELLEKLLRTAELLPDVAIVDLGGGWGTPFLDGDHEYDLAAFSRRANDMLQKASERLRRTLTLHVEPGGYLLMDSGVLLTTVTELKPGHPFDDMSPPSFAGVDASYNHVVSAVMYGTQHPITVADEREAPRRDVYDIAGNLMQAGDILGRARRLPELHVGDVLVIGHCGAYTACRTTTFNSRPAPAEVLVDGTDVKVIRRRGVEQDLYAFEEL